MRDNSSPKPATIYDVAERAGVSHITVSRVVNGKQNVSAETRERVQKAMDELNYTPNPIAQTLQTRRSRIIELVTTNVYGSDAPAVAAMLQITQANDFVMSILPTTVDQLPAVLKKIPNRMVAGTILYAQEVSLEYPVIQRVVRRYPIVHMGGKSQSGLPSVMYDQKMATSQAIQYLIDLGHKQIAFIGGQQILLDGLDRYHAYLETMSQNHLTPGPIAFGDFASESGERAAYELLKNGKPFTALFASSDAMAAGAMYVLKRAGRRIPEDVSVIGYNNWDSSRYFSPPLTTIVNDLGVLGRMTAEYLFEMVHKPDTPRHQRVIIPELLIRESTAKPSQK